MDVVTNARVVRGPDWKSESDDGGDGHLGTVVAVKRHYDGNVLPVLIVQWDNGNRHEYRYGSEGCYDLRVFDNASAGVIFPNHWCDGCKTHPITGMRFNCNQCFDFDLCLKCYHAGEHDVDHDFTRVDYVNGSRTKLPPRNSSQEGVAKGLFVGATVVRGHDWEWENQDGGPGKPGKLIQVKGWSGDSDGDGLRDAARIEWEDGTTNIYRVGSEGKVDLKYTEAGSGGTYYPEHLPTLGVTYQAVLKQFEEGDIVKVQVKLEDFEKLQEGHGSWEDSMSELLEQFGKVVTVRANGDLRVRYEDRAYTINPSCVTKVITHSVGDMVKIIDDEAKVRDLQEGHGGWVDEMASCIGSVGRVIEVYPDGDVQIRVNGDDWILNPYCAVPARPEEIAGLQSPSRQPVQKSLSVEMESYMMLTAASTGDITTVQSKLESNPKLVDATAMDKAMIHCAIAADDSEMVKLLLKFNANLEIGDADDDTPLHLCAYEDRIKLAELLVDVEANINSKNVKGLTPLMVAAGSGAVDVLKLLVTHHKVAIDMQDSAGNTALYWGVVREEKESVKMLLDAKANPAIANSKSFTPIHEAAKKGFAFAMEEFINRFPEQVALKKEDGFTPLHLAAYYDRLEVLNLLGEKSTCNLDEKESEGRTALHLAVSRCHPRIVERLVGYGANLNAQTLDGDTPLHLILSETKQIVLRNVADMPHLIKARHEYNIPLGNDKAVIACFLVQEGADLSIRNKKDKTPHDMCSSDLAEFVNSASKAERSKQYHGSLRSRGRLASLPSFATLQNVKKGESIPFSDLDLSSDEILGEGGFGTVFIGRWVPKKVTVAVKMISGRIRKREAELLSQIDHPNIVDYYGEAIGEHQYAIVTEYVRGGSLHDLIHKNKVHVEPEQRIRWATEIAQGMAYLHEKKICHRDLKSLNVMLTDDLVTKIIDFGEAKDFDKTSLKTQVGTQRWMAPEILDGKPYSMSADVYSYGMVLYEIFTYSLPYGGTKTFEIPIKKINNEVPPIPNGCIADIAILMRDCWKMTPEDRPTFADIVLIFEKGVSTEEVDAPEDTPPAITGEDKVLTLNDLPMLTTKLEDIAAVWMPLGSALRMEANSLSGIPKVAGGKPSSCLVMVLLQYLQSKEFTPTIGFLVQAVRSIPGIKDGEKVAQSLLQL